MPFLRLRNLASGETLEFETPEIRIGREPDSELVLSAEGSGVVSGRHARVFERGGGWWLEDVGSRNGTFLNDRRLMPGAAEQLTTSAVVGFGERGPRFRVEAVAKRRIADTLVEGPTAIRPSAATVPMEGIDATAPPASVAQGTPSPPPPPPQELRVVLMEALTGEQHQATGGRLRIGRGKECELRPVGPDDTSVSRVHTEIVLKPDGKVVVRDAQSRNGTYLGDELLTAERELKQGDRLKLGAAGPELLVAHLTKPGERPAEEKKERRRKRLSSAAARAAEKLGAARRSFGGKGATVFFSEMFAETSRKSARRVRIVVWSSVVVLAGAAGGFYYYKDQLEQRLERQLEQQLAAQQAVADSIRN
ncbi:MAG: FHA domain-containing protein, partial [Armatimonadota bacterium]